MWSPLALGLLEATVKCSAEQVVPLLPKHGGTQPPTHYATLHRLTWSSSRRRPPPPPACLQNDTTCSAEHLIAASRRPRASGDHINRHITAMDVKNTPPPRYSFAMGGCNVSAIKLLIYRLCYL